MTRIVAVGADHGGFSLKVDLVPWLQSQGYQVLDQGAHSFEPADDYPDIVETVAAEVISGRAERGILICGSGVGAAVAANKFPGIRACLCHDVYSAHQGVEHDELNILCLGGRIIGVELAKELVSSFLNASFTGEERHRRRMAKVAAIEQRALQGNPSRSYGGGP